MPFPWQPSFSDAFYRWPVDSSMVPFASGALGFGATLLPPFRQVAIAEMVPTFL